MNQPSNVIFWGCHSPSAVKAITALQAENIISIGAWFGNAAECTHKLNPFLHQFKIDSDASTNKTTPPLLTARELVIFLDMYSRVSRSRGLNTQELIHSAQIYYSFFANLIERKKINIVIFSSPPHFGVDFLLYTASRKLGRQTAFCYQTLFPNRFFACRSLEDFGQFIECQQITELEHIKIEPGHKKNLFYMNSIKHRPERPTLSLINDVRRNILRSSSKPMNLSGIIEKYRETRDWNRNTKNFSSKHADLNCKYVYFPLQLQPEMTTSALGSHYSDQLSAIEAISDMIPDNWFIYVKENPKQTHRQRGETFMRRLRNIPKARYLDKSIDTYELLEHSQFPATVTGTIGWESISGGKPALVFGNPWYKNLPGIINYKIGLQVEEILCTNLNHKDLEEKLSWLLTKSLKGVIDPCYAPIVDNYNDVENSSLIRKFLELTINGALFKKDTDVSRSTEAK